MNNNQPSQAELLDKIFQKLENIRLWSIDITDDSIGASIYFNSDWCLIKLNDYIEHQQATIDKYEQALKTVQKFRDMREKAGVKEHCIYEFVDLALQPTPFNDE